MTSERAKAYRRVVTMLREIGPASLWPSEEARIREAADMLLFCRDLDAEEARTAFAAVGTITDSLIERGAVDQLARARFLDDIWACGPGAAMLEAVAA